MHLLLEHRDTTYRADLRRPLSIAIPLRESEQPNCFYAPLYYVEPVRGEGFVGDTSQGGLVNFKTVHLNPHGSGTHTECVGHIAVEPYSLRDCLRAYHHLAKVVTVYPEAQPDGDRVITYDQVEALLTPGDATALVIRTMPNDALKMRTVYSGTNPPYIHHSAVAYMVECGIQHLLIDLPSVDRAEDEGRLLAHRAFWQYPEAIRVHSTITELIYVNPAIPDGLYCLELQVAPFTIDVSPSNPVLYRLEEV